MAAAFPCPHCAHPLVSEEDEQLERCPKCEGALLIAYRYRLVSAGGELLGGVLYEALDDGFGERVAVLFVDDPNDAEAVERFVAGNRLFADLGGRGLVKIYDVGRASDRRAHVIMDWLEGGTLDALVSRTGPLPAAQLFALIDDLLTGLSKAHRAMPAIVHGQIHPGKIGFRRQGGGEGQGVLCGFEWATQVNAQASQLADSFISGEQVEQLRTPASDLRQLAASFYYAATGEWIGDDPLAQQREQVRMRVPAPLAHLLDRMLGAGQDGYKSAVEAAIDFEQLRRGADSWPASSAHRQERSDARMGAWGAGQDDDEGEDEDEEFEDYLESILAPPSGPSKPTPAQNWGAPAFQQRAQAQVASKPSRGVVTVISALVSVGLGAGFCAVQLAEMGEAASLPRGAPAVEVIREPPPVQPVPEPPGLAGVFRYTGEVTGPEVFAGLALGERCVIFVEPNEGQLNCRWYIDCGQPRRRIYGGGKVGYSSCEIDAQGQPLRAQDNEDDAADGAFLADFANEPGLLIIQDRWIEPPVRVLITIDEGAPYMGRIPRTEHAPRDSAAEIQRRIDRGESPTIEGGVIAQW